MLKSAFLDGPRVGRSLPWMHVGVVLAAGMIVLFGFEAVQHPELNRWVLALLIAMSLALVAVRRPGTAVLLTFVFLAVLGLVRRLLIPVAGWSAYDPLLLVAPAASICLFVRGLLLQRRKLAPDLISKLIVALMLLMLAEAFNPLGVGVLAGVAGLLFVAAPLVWFFIGREVANRDTVSLLLRYVAALGFGSAIYGLFQISSMPPWDMAWMNIAGYRSLYVTSEYTYQGIFRSFGTFSSSSEYASYLGIALVVTVALVLRGRMLALLAVPVISWALFLDSSRGILVQVVVGVILLIALLTTKRLAVIPVVAVTIVAIVFGAGLFGPAVEGKALGSANALIIHQVNGLLHPLDPKQSTLMLHWQEVADSLSGALHSPLGYGTGAVTRADKFGVTGAGSEQDVTSAFGGLGLPGGLLFMAIVAMAFSKALSAYRQQRDFSSLCIPAILLVTFLQWLNGGQYAIAPLVWFVIGWATQESSRVVGVTEAGRIPTRGTVAVSGV